MGIFTFEPTIKELELLTEKGFNIVCLGSLTLRVDTATVVAISTTQQLIIARENWKTTLPIK